MHDDAHELPLHEEVLLLALRDEEGALALLDGVLLAGSPPAAFHPKTRERIAGAADEAERVTCRVGVDAEAAALRGLVLVSRSAGREHLHQNVALTRMKARTARISRL